MREKTGTQLSWLSCHVQVSPSSGRNPGKYQNRVTQYRGEQGKGVDSLGDILPGFILEQEWELCAARGESQGARRKECSPQPISSQCTEADNLTREILTFTQPIPLMALQQARHVTLLAQFRPPSSPTKTTTMLWLKMTPIVVARSSFIHDNKP